MFSLAMFQKLPSLNLSLQHYSQAVVTGKLKRGLSKYSRQGNQSIPTSLRTTLSQTPSPSRKQTLQSGWEGAK